MHHRLNFERLQGFNVCGIEKTFKQQNPLVPAAAADDFSIAKIDRSQAVCIGKSCHRIVETVTVCIGLHYRPERPACGFRTHDAEIMAKRFKINFCGYGTRHLRSFSPISLSEEHAAVFLKKSCLRLNEGQREAPRAEFDIFSSSGNTCVAGLQRSVAKSASVFLPAQGSIFCALHCSPPLSLG